MGKGSHNRENRSHKREPGVTNEQWRTIRREVNKAILFRIYTLRDLGYDPYVMVYDKPNAPKEIRRLQRWVNNKFIFRKTAKFEDYQG